MSTDVHEFISDLNGGVFEQMLSRCLSDVAAGVVDHEKKGVVQITFSMERIGGSQQVAIAHKLSYSQPKPNGKVVEEHTTKTPMHVNRGGKLTLFPENQHQMFDKSGAPKSHNEER